MQPLQDKEYTKQTLNKVPLFSGLKDNWDALGALSEIMTVEVMSPKTAFIKEGELGDRYFILLEGQVSIYKKTPDGDIYKVVILKSDINPGLGEAGLIEPEPRSATVETDVECKFLVLTMSHFGEFCQKYPQWAVPILKRISMSLMGRLKQMNNDLGLLHKALMSEIRGM